MELFVARQPVFDRELDVVGYELLFRSGYTDTIGDHEDMDATSKVINAAFYTPGGESILRGKPAFVNFSRGLLLNQSAAVLPPHGTVIEILESVEPDDEVIAACKELRSYGFRIALDDFMCFDTIHPLASLAHFIKVDFRVTTLAQQELIARRYRGSVNLLAEKVETFAEFETAAALGFSHFQGYFFARPVITATRELEGFKLHYLRLLRLLQYQELDFFEIGQIIEQEPALSYKLLRYVNSALIGRRTSIHSIRQALLILGENEIRRWLSLIIVLDLTSDKPTELAMNALLRARFSELLAPESALAHRAGDLFLTGILSRLDAMLDRSLESILRGLSLEDHINQALLGIPASEDRFNCLWQLVLAHEAAEWDRVENLAGKLQLKADRLLKLFADAAQWAAEVYRN